MSMLGNGVQSEIECSIIHWPELDWSDSDEYSEERDCEYFEKLKTDSYNFFREFDNLVVGKKIAEGAQGEIYEATLVNERMSDGKFVVKGFKRGTPLRSLQCQWPQGMFSWCWFGRIDPQMDEEMMTPLQWIHGGTLLKDKEFKNRFAIVVQRQWGDLRKVIDQQMVRNSSGGPPFHHDPVLGLMLYIAHDMNKLHENLDVIHKDLKASNVLIRPWTDNIEIAMA